ncbi:MAG: CshA/CshB family fibrillar adhesin-related protein [Aeromicrobium sp.]|uniref:CshA/CshB family fibrillar adhesin-related protein n=1 Tax=Aeromicrobium sp. TaxID=1871063 RepID=UPI0039E502DE
MLGAALTLISPLTAEARYATGGSGLYRDSIDWFEWGTNGSTISDDGVTKTNTRTVADQALVTTCTLGSLTREGGGDPTMTAFNPGNYTGSGLDNLYNIGGTGTSNSLITGLRVLQHTVTSTVSCSVTLGGVPVEPAGLVIAEAEQSSGPLEHIAMRPSTPATWHAIDFFAGGTCAYDTTAIIDADNQLRLYGDMGAVGNHCGSAGGPTSVMFMEGATSGDITVSSPAGASAMAIGVVLSSDFGDAPSSYGEAGHLYAPSYASTQPLAEGTNVVGRSYPLATPVVTTRLGATIDAESATQAADGSDEDAVGTLADIPITVGSTHTQTVACSNGQVQGWIDWNVDGAFDAGEASGVVPCTGTDSTADLSWTIPSTATNLRSAPSYMRLRIGADAAAVESPTGMSTSGEAEDHAVTLANAVSTELLIDKEAELDDVNGNGYADVGETISYSFEVENAGNAALSDVTVTDPRVTGITPDPLATLGIGEVHTFTSDPYTVTQADVDAGQVDNSATVRGTDPDAGEVVSDPDVVIVPGPPRDPSLTIEKSSEFTNDQNGDGVANLGDVLEYTFVVTNTGNVTLTDVTVDDAKVSGLDPATATLAPGASQEFTASYTVTQADVDAGGVANTATATGTPPSGTPGGPVTSEPDDDLVDGEDPDPLVTIEKSADITTDDGAADRGDAGDVITYSFEVTNHGAATAENVTVADPLSGLSAISPDPVDLGPDESQVFTATYTVTQDDVDRGYVTNQATAAFSAGGTERESSPSEIVTVPMAEADPGLTIDKSASLDDADGDGVAGVGETITYSFALENTGNVTLAGVAVTDEMVSDFAPASVDLAPGETGTISAPYVVTQDDVDAGEILNTALARGTVPGGQEFVSDPDEHEFTELPEADPALELVKTAVLDDANDNGLADVGESVTYGFVATNTGNITLTDVTVSDPKLTGLTPESVDRLRPGSSVEFSADPYAVTADDLEDGSVDNVATATGTSSRDGETAITGDGESHVPGTPAPATSDPDDDGWLPTTGLRAALALLMVAVLAASVGAVVFRHARQRRTT